MINKKLFDECSELIVELVELMWDDNESECKIKNCNKPDSISCGNRLCIDENIEYWKNKLKGIFEGNTDAL